MSHTPGPWKSSGQWIFGPKSMPLPVASGYQDYATSPGGQYYAEACANARLIAAAPELLAALVEVREMLFARPDIVRALRPMMGWAENAVSERAAAAIAKATSADLRRER